MVNVNSRRKKKNSRRNVKIEKKERIYGNERKFNWKKAMNVRVILILF